MARHDSTEIPDDQETILTSHHNLASVDGGAQHLGLMLEALDTLARLQVVDVQAVIVSADQSQWIVEEDVPDDCLAAVLLMNEICMTDKINLSSLP